MEALELVIEGAAGIVGVGALTAVDTFEQRLTGRPDVLVAPAPGSSARRPLLSRRLRGFA